MSDPHSRRNEAGGIHGAMLAITAATKSLFAKPTRESTIARLQLTLYLDDTFSCDIGQLVCDAIDCGQLKDLELAILGEKICWEYSPPDMLRRSQDMDGFFRAYPSALGCLTRLSLCSLSFVGLDMHHILFDCCKQLTHLALISCDAGLDGPWKIDAPNSKLRVMDLDRCRFGTIQLISLPKLEKVNWVFCVSQHVPLSFGFVPSLKELCLAHFLYPDQHLLKLSELLHAAAGIHILTLDFIGKTIWLQLEIKQLASAFSKLKKLSILGVFVEFDLLWTTAFLRAAPSVEILHIQVYEPCEMEHMHSPWRAHKRTDPQWKPHFRGSKNLFLRELHIDHFRPLKQQLTFIRAILERAPNLQMVFLNKDGEKCGQCDAMASNESPSASAWPTFPKTEEEQDMVVRRVTDDKSFSGRIIFQ
ncbi:unnamed protein product [Alopecurus aequalis]